MGRTTAGIRVLIVDDHPVVRHGLMAALDRQPDLRVAGAVATLDHALRLCRAEPPDVVLLDLRLPGTPPEQAVAQILGVGSAGCWVLGAERPILSSTQHPAPSMHARLADARSHYPAPSTQHPAPTPRILLLSTDEAGEDLCRALEAGAAGCVLRTAEMEEMVVAIRTLHTGGAWLSKETAEQCRAGARLCDEELACLRLLAAGKTSRQIAVARGWSEREVGEVLRRVQRKLQAKNKTHMLVTALRRGIVSLD